MITRRENVGSRKFVLCWGNFMVIDCRPGVSVDPDEA